MEPGKVSDGEKACNRKDYQAAIGSLNYAMIASRPDICFAVGTLSQFMSNPSLDHRQGMKRIFRYLKGTLDNCLAFDANDANLELQGYSDANWAGDVYSKRSTSGYIFQLAGSTVSWGSKRQSVVALSTTEAEYISISAATQEAIWLRRLMKSLGIGWSSRPGCRKTF